jgi:RNA polymerase sigma factor (sigma-70 family)
MAAAPRKDWILTAYSSFLVAFKARQLCRRNGFAKTDREDVENELWASLANHADRFDPSRASFNTYVDRVVNTTVAMILRSRRQQKRAAGFHARSINASAACDKQPSSLSDSLTMSDLGRRNGIEAADDNSQCIDNEAVHHALAQMPEELRDICRRLMGGTISSVARDLAITRRQVRNAISAARPFLERAGFGTN